MDLTKALGPLTKKFIWDYTTTSSISVFEVKHLFLYALQKLMQALYDVLLCILVLVVYSLLVLAKLSVIIFPFVQMMSKVIIEYHYSLNWIDIALEITVLSIIILFLIFKKRIMLYWHRLEKSVSAKFRYMVRLAPHVLFFTFAFIFSIVGQKILVPFASFHVLPVISLAIPTIKTYFILQNTSDNHIRSYNKLRDQLLLWVVLGAYHALATSFGQIPFSRKVLNYSPYVRELFLVIMVWIQISPFFTKIAFEASSPALKYIASKIPASDIGYAQSLGITSGLKFMNIITYDQEVFIKSLLQDGATLVIAIIFIFFPTPIAYIGVVIIAFLFPIFRTYRHIHANDEIANAPVKRRRESSSKDNTDANEDHNMTVNHEQLRRWLRYWTCLGSLWLLKIYGGGIWPSILMIICLWLQHSYFDGSKKLLGSLREVGDALNERNERIRRIREGQGSIDDTDHIGIDAADATYENDVDINTITDEDIYVPSNDVEMVDDDHNSDHSKLS